MDRREALKALGVVPFVRLPFEGKELPAVEVAPRKYWVFVDVQTFDVEEFCANPMPWPNIDVELFRVKPRPGMTVEDAIVIYELDAKEKATEKSS